jgi:hypothetical protein
VTGAEADPRLSALLLAGRLGQTCPACGAGEAAGFYCTACYSPTGPAEWLLGLPMSPVEPQGGPLAATKVLGDLR